MYKLALTLAALMMMAACSNEGGYTEQEEFEWITTSTTTTTIPVSSTTTMVLAQETTTTEHVPDFIDYWNGEWDNMLLEVKDEYPTFAFLSQFEILGEIQAVRDDLVEKHDESETWFGVAAAGALVYVWAEQNCEPYPLLNVSSWLYEAGGIGALGTVSDVQPPYDFFDVVFGNLDLVIEEIGNC